MGGKGKNAQEKKAGIGPHKRHKRVSHHHRSSGAGSCLHAKEMRFHDQRVTKLVHHFLVPFRRDKCRISKKCRCFPF